MRGFTSLSSIFDATVPHHVALKSQRKNANFCTFLFAGQRILLVSQIGEWEEILRKKLHISYIGYFVVPPIFNIYSVIAS